MSMGESTRRKLEGVVRGAAAAPGAAPGQYVGGYQGGLGGSWGKANRGLGGGNRSAAAGDNSANAGAAATPAARPTSAKPSSGMPAGPIPTHDAAGYSPAGSQRQTVGVREKTRPASAGIKSIWDQVPKELPKAPPHALTSGKMRPTSATMAHTTRPLAGTTSIPVTEYTLRGTGLEPNKKTTAGLGSSFSGAQAPAMGSASTKRPDTGPTPSNPATAAILERSRRDLEELRSAEGGDTPQLTEAHLAALEDAIRDAVRAQRSVYEGSKDMLLKLFRAVDDGSGDVSIPEFCNVCSQVGILISPAEAAALFRRFGCDTAMPYERFAHTLLTQPARQLAEDVPVRKGAFQAGAVSNFNGKLLYRYCRKPVYTPSDWDPALALRSAELPQARLVLEFVYGYQGKDNTAQNLFYTAEGKLVYYTAGVGVVYQRPPVHHQHFFLGHTDDITALALCPAAVDVDGTQYPARTLVATGQVTSTEEGAFICVWDSRLNTRPDGPAAVPELVRLKLDKDARGVCALGFSPTGNRLVAVTTDNQHTVYVYDWRKQRVVSTGKGQMGDPPQVYGVEWNPHEGTSGAPSAFLTFGRKHIKCWTADSTNPNAWVSKSWSFGRQPMQNVTSAQWLPPRPGSGGDCIVVAGVADGSLYVFKGSACIKSVAAHRPGPQIIQADGHPAYAGVRGLRLCKNNSVLLSGGADGAVLQWDVSDGSLVDARLAGPSMQITSPFGPTDKYSPSIRALDYSPELDKIVVGTNHCDINELTPSSTDVLMDGHSGDVYMVTCHPTQPHVLATVSDSGHVHVWDASTRQMTHCAAMGWAPRALAFSPLPINTAGGTGGHHLAVGGTKGHIKVLDAGANLKPLHSTRDSKEGISDLKYSPNARFLAAATFDTWVDIYNVSKEYTRIARCSGHSSTVRCIDWNIDGSVLQSASADLELLYWNARTGKQITLPQRDTQFHTWTCALGFPVMGIWPPGADGTDINAVDRSHDQQEDQKLVVTADDKGLVKLFNYPCVVEDAPHRAYRGHSSHVMGTRFNSNDSMVFSVGGRDWAIFQFRVVRLQPDAPPPPAQTPVWGPLDPAGKAYGYTTTPATLTQGPTSPALAPAPPQPPSQSAGLPGVQGSPAGRMMMEEEGPLQGSPSLSTGPGASPTAGIASAGTYSARPTTLSTLAEEASLASQGALSSASVNTTGGSLSKPQGKPNTPAGLGDDDSTGLVNRAPGVSTGSTAGRGAGTTASGAGAGMSTLASFADVSDDLPSPAGIGGGQQPGSANQIKTSGASGQQAVGGQQQAGQQTRSNPVSMGLHADQSENSEEGGEEEEDGLAGGSISLGGSEDL